MKAGLELEVASGSKHRRCSREGCETPLVQSDLNIAVPDTLEINHRRGNVVVAHPLLQSADINAVLQMPRGIGVTEFMKKPPPAVRAVGTAVGFHAAVR